MGKGASTLLPIAVSLLAGCATVYNPATGREEVLFIDSASEAAIGEQARREMGLTSLNVGGVESAQWERVQRIGKRLSEVSDRKDVVYRFGVVRDETMNAFALPGGTLYVHSGLLEKATDPELAAVLGHELGHIAARHAVKQLQAQIGVAALLGLVESAAGANAAAGRRIGTAVFNIFAKGFSRSDELEADRLGIRYLDRAGFDPKGTITFFEKMLRERPEGPMDRAFVWQSTHPLARDRIAAASEEIRKLQPQKFCPECGRETEGDARFCPVDGTALKPKKKEPVG